MKFRTVKYKKHQLVVCALTLGLIGCRPAGLNPDAQSPAQPPEPVYQGRLDLPATARLEGQSVAGMNDANFADGPADQAAFAYPWHLVEQDGQLLVADRFNHRIRSVQAGEVTTLYGQRFPELKDAQGTDAQFNNPQYLLVDREGVLWVSDTGNHALRRIDQDGNVSTVSTDFDVPNGLALFANGDIGIADAGRNQILRWEQSSQSLQVFAGSGAQGFQDGAADSAEFFSPRDIAIDGDTVYVADSFNHRIRRIRDGQVETLAGGAQAGEQDGQGSAAELNEPSQIILDGNGDLIVLDFVSQRVRHLTQDGELTSLRLEGGFRHIQSLFLDVDALWSTDARRHEVWKFELKS